MDKIRIKTPLSTEVVLALKAGDEVLISGYIYTARDAAHLKLIDMIDRGVPLPINLEGEVIYYAGPSPAKPGEVIGACGPTTSYRMDSMTPQLLALGLKGMIGKGDRDDQVIEAMVQTKSVYFAAIGGAGALISNSVLGTKIIAFEELGAEALVQLQVIDFPAVVAIDCKGNDLYKESPDKFKIAPDKY